MYDQREKPQRDYIWMMIGSRKGGFAEVVEPGLEQELEGGKLAGKMQLVQELLGEPLSSGQELNR
ncbi:MAG: hypothetical protein RLY14_717 [Planctomycetota bacterium]|jgi:hypothetical protein